MTSITLPKSLISIGSSFYCCESLSNIYYRGSQDEWNAITINESGNTDLTNATITYNYTGTN